MQGFVRFESRPDCLSSASLSSWVFVCVTNHLRGLNGEIDECNDVSDTLDNISDQRAMQLRKQIVSSWNNGLQYILFKQEEC